MNNNLLIGILGKSKSGKTFTWDTLFCKSVRTGKNLRRLFFNETEYVEVFLLSRSPQKRHMSVESIISSNKPRIVLCSMQYVLGVKTTLSYFSKNNFFLFIHWLNPGFKDENDSPLFYNSGILNHILSCNSIVGVRNGKENPEIRVQEIKDFVYGWAKSRNLVKLKRLRKK